MNKSLLKTVISSTYIKEQEKLELEEVFSLMDPDINGNVRTQELLDILESLGNDSRKSTVYILVNKRKKEGKEFLSKEEFINLMSRPFYSLEIKEEFGDLYTQYTGLRETINFTSLKETSMRLGEQLDDYEIRQMLKYAKSEENQNEVDINNFYNALTNPFFRNK